MEVFEFKKSLLVRHQEASHVLGVRNDPIPASMVRKEWSLFLEIAMEPTGWQALWRIPRAVCQELSTKFPTVVMGTIEKVSGWSNKKITLNLNTRLNFKYSVTIPY